MYNHQTDNREIQSYSDFLQEIVERIHPLIRDHRARFEQQAYEFINKYETWYKQRQDNIAGALEKPIYHSEVKPDKKPKKVPKEYVLYSPGGSYTYQETENGKVREIGTRSIKVWYWGKPLPNNPMDTLLPETLSEMYSKKGKILREPKTPEEDLLRKYFLYSS